MSTTEPKLDEIRTGEVSTTRQCREVVLMTANADKTKVLTEFLESNDIKVMPALTGKLALDLIDRHCADVVIYDYDCKHLSLPEFKTLARRMHSSVTIIAFGPKWDGKTQHHADYYLNEPVAHRELLHALTQYANF